MNTAVPHYIIAIGASAGGLEEINAFFDHTPLDGVSYVIIQHLSPDFKSRMVELLARHSKLEVVEAADGMTVECNKVYLIPNTQYMTIHNGVLHLSSKEKTQTPHLTINRFFNSLAADIGKKAIGIVLSGLGSDGTEGVRAIKNAGGMVIARNPETTEFGSMPGSAIATGVVDLVLEPEQMPGAIEDYLKYGGDLIADHMDDDKDMKAIIDLIKEMSPLDFSDYKQTTILRRTKRRAAHGNFSTLSSYYDHLKKTPKEIDALSKDFLISVTSFFRDKEAFEVIQNEIFPDLIKRLTPGEELKMWVAGCATGEEVYSLAILIHEQLTGEHQDTVVKLFATDIDSSALVHAGKALYNTSCVKNIPAALLEKYFIKEGNNYRVTPDIRKMVIFAQHDLVKNPPYCNMHFISCRNLLIYMTPVLQKKVFTMLLFGLKMHGYLFLGSSENPMPIIKNLEVVNKKWKLYKNLETKRMVRFDTFSLPELLDTKRPSFSATADDGSKNMNNTVTEAVNMALADELGRLIICVDEYNNVIRSYGDTTKYLLQKNFNTDLLELLPKPLAIAFNTLSRDVLRTNNKAGVSGIKIKQGTGSIKVNLSVTPLSVKGTAQRSLMVTFSEDRTADVAPHENAIYDEAIYHDQYTLNMEDELKELKYKLSSTYEQLDASYENMQSFNEELLSANEEMQSTNEEMQSVNEELDTINLSYQIKNKELLDINDDLNNYFRSNINGQLFLDNDLRLMKFSPGTVKQINLQESDIGRPISNISTNIKFETMIDDIRRVLAEGIVITKDVETNNGKWYQIMTMPYVQSGNKNNGVIITFYDITELKHTQEDLDKKNISLLRINADLDNFVHTAAHDLLAPLGNIELSIAMANELEVKDPQMTDFMRVINSSIKKFRTLVRDISTIAKIEGDMIELERVGLDEVISNIEWSLDDRITASGAVIHKKLEVKHIMFSKKNMRSILYNLISNAIKFRRDESPVVNISTRKAGDNIILTVEDNGIGIPKEGMDRIFDIYGRLHQDIEGQGIGLYLAKKIVDSTGGDIVVESEPGKGSKFMIYLKVEHQGKEKVLS